MPVEITIKNGSKVWYRYNKRCKWKPGFATHIDYSFKLPFGVKEIVKHLGKTYRPFAFRVSRDNIKIRE